MTRCIFAALILAYTVGMWALIVWGAAWLVPVMMGG